MEPTPSAPPARPAAVTAGGGVDPHLVAFLAEQDTPCPACTYNLRGLQSDRCPECNRALELQLRLAEPKQSEWIAAVAGASVMAGFHTLLFAYFVWIKVSRRYGGSWDGTWPLMVFGPFGGFLLWRLLRGRRAFCNRPDGVRRVWTVGVWLAAVASAFLFFAGIR